MVSPKMKQLTKTSTSTNVKLPNLTSDIPNAHANTFMAVGTPITAVAAEKYNLEKSDIPTVNI